MSIEQRRSLAIATADAEAFARLIAPEATCERFQVCGSIRRQCPTISDVDIVCIAKTGLTAGGGLFGGHVETNLLWARVDELVTLGTFTKFIKETKAGPRAKWGDMCRGIGFKGVCYEIQLCDGDNFGPWMAIRTGPAELSHEFAKRFPSYMTAKPGTKYATRDGFHVWDMAGPHRLVAGVTEEQFFAMAGLQFRPPEKRGVA